MPSDEWWDALELTLYEHGVDVMGMSRREMWRTFRKLVMAERYVRRFDYAFSAAGDMVVVEAKWDRARWDEGTWG